MKEKLTTLEAVAGMVRDGDQIILSGDSGGSPSPMAAIRRLVRDGRKDLRLVGVVGATVNADLPIGAGAVASIDTCSVGMSPFARTGPNFARHCEAGRIKAMDNT